MPGVHHARDTELSTGNRHRVFAYGSNMHLADLGRWMASRDLGVPVVHGIEPASLPNHRLAWNYRSPSRHGGAANVEASAGDKVPGIVLTIDDGTLAALDRKEGHPERYSRGAGPVRLQRLDGADTIEAWVYVVTAAWRTEGEPAWPRPAYLALLVDAAVSHGLPAWHIAALRSTPTS